MVGGDGKGLLFDETGDLKHHEVGQGNQFSPAIPGKPHLTDCTTHTFAKNTQSTSPV
jgi:hypothetical protein